MKRLFQNTYFQKIKNKRSEKTFSGDAGNGAWRWLIGGCLTVVLVLMFPKAQSLRFADMRF